MGFKMDEKMDPGEFHASGASIELAGKTSGKYPAHHSTTPGQVATSLESQDVVESGHATQTTGLANLDGDASANHPQSLESDSQANGDGEPAPENQENSDLLDEQVREFEEDLRAVFGDGIFNFPMADTATAPRPAKRSRRGGDADFDTRRRHRSRSRSRDRGAPPARARKDRDRDGVKDNREGRDKGRRDDTRTRSRSPAKKERDGYRARSPPRGPRSARSPARGSRAARSPPRGPKGQHAPSTASGSVAGTRAAGPSQPNSRDPARPFPVQGQRQRELPEDADDELKQMQSFMGFSSFKTTQNTKVPGNYRNYAVNKEKSTTYRQYMNRSGGFNRPLSPSAD